MIDAFLAEIGRHLSTGNSARAEELALELPHLAAALTDSQLQSSRGQYVKWCEDWVAAPQDAQMFLQWHSRALSSSSEVETHVPAEALRILRLQRLAREIPSPTLQRQDESTAPSESAEGTCAALLQAARKWYAQVGRHDKVVQENLGRLGVLR